jgi:hypothetical protein
MKKLETDIDAFKLILPNEIFDYFDVIGLQENEEQVDISLDEKDIVPQGHTKNELESKGFHQSVLIQDFPLRRRKVFLHVRRRKWLVKSSGNVISRNWDLMAKGTHFTKEFAFFLKGILG